MIRLNNQSYWQSFKVTNGGSQSQDTAFNISNVFISQFYTSAIYDVTQNEK